MTKIEIDHFDGDLPIDNLSDSNNYDLKYLDACDLNYANFFEKFMLRNLPCIIRNITSSWQCTNNWIKNEKINIEYLIDHYGDVDAPVADCDAITFNAHCKINMKVKEYMQYLQSCERDKLLYLKDWHLRRLRPNDLFYEVPLFFGSDWLNEFATDRGEDDFMFVYIGPTKSWTPLHADVYNSYSWSVNVVGQKKWTLFPPGEEEKLKDSLGNLPVMFHPEKFPGVKFLEIVQDGGDALFVPSGWHHQVVNLLDTISINHNWVNACNIENVWSSLQQCLSSVEYEIRDLKDSPEYISQCQVILKSLFGMDFSNFLIFLSYIGNKRITQLRKENSKGFNNIELGQNHIMFDLKTLHKVMNLIQNHPIFSYNCISPDIESDFIKIKKSISMIL
ncbi:2-oxoglutarate and iron-dependent oxygenase JMJD4 [Pectinophora gossypiella]|uniref:2-oxoglutarate and iron-dependent oxygenase JMJD4 n=1 Tax=Pectinophora gossypiella TaxID=13191 RepID=UPI00214F3045|nr:2-oxoglutarate and iron-dependent oxygenase JMJD4 [Pectinophora gossypiella]